MPKKSLVPCHPNDKIPVFGDDDDVAEIDPETIDGLSSVDFFGKYKMDIPPYVLKGKAEDFVNFITNLAALKRVLLMSESEYGYKYARRIYIGDVLIGYAYRGEFIFRDLRKSSSTQRPAYVVFSTYNMYDKLRDAKHEIKKRTEGFRGYDRRDTHNRNFALGA